MKKYVFVFPGQGSQFKNMALDDYEKCGAVRELFELCSDLNGFDMKAYIEDGDFSQTGKTQLAVTLANLAAAANLEELGITPAAAAGHSLGEYAALTVSGVLSKEDCFKLVAVRGQLMSENIKHIDCGGGMAAVTGLPPEKITALLDEWQKDGFSGVYAANFNSLRQTVIAGTSAALVKASELFKEAGARRVLKLDVAGPFHSPLMAEAADRFAIELQNFTFGDTGIPVFSNVTGKPYISGCQAQKLLALQITHPVLWTDIERHIAERCPDTIVESGPGSVLQGLWLATGSDIPCVGYSVHKRT